MCVQQLKRDLENKYDEWLEMGMTWENILIPLLEREVEKNRFLEKRLAELENSRSCKR